MTYARLGVKGTDTAKERALFKEIAQNEIIVKFNAKTNFGEGTHDIRTIENGVGAEFEVFEGENSVHYHVIGQDTTKDSALHNNFIINVDAIAYKAYSFYALDEWMSHNAAQKRAKYVDNISLALANNQDTNIMATAIKASRAASDTGRDGGTEVLEPSALTDGKKLAGAMYAAAAALDDKSVPEEGRRCFVKPTQYYSLVQNLDAINKDFGGMGSYSDGKITRIAGIELVKTTRLPQGTLTGTYSNKYDGDFSNVAALIMTPEAVGTVKLREVETTLYKDEGKFDETIRSHYVKGHGILKPATSVSIITTATV